MSQEIRSDFDLGALAPKDAPVGPPDEASKPVARKGDAEPSTYCKETKESLNERQANLLMERAGTQTREALRQCSAPTEVDGTLYEQGGSSLKWHRALGAKLRITF